MRAAVATHTPFRPAAAREEAGIRGPMLALLLGVTVLQRFALPVAGSDIAVVLPLGFAVVAELVRRGRLVVDVARLLHYLGAATALLATLFVGKTWFSPTSVALLLAVYVPFVFQLRAGWEEFIATLRDFQALMLALAAVGIAQFGLQFAIGPDWIFPLDRLLPAAWFLPNYVTVNPLYDGAEIVRSNGLVFLEASHFSQFLAFAVLVELRFFRRRLWLAVFGAALFVSFSGTGLFLVLLLAPFVVLRQRDLATVGLGLAAVAVLAVAGEALVTQVFLGRLAEFGETQASGFSRFVSPFVMLDQHLLDRPVNVLFGMGPGAATQVILRAAYLAHDPSWFKLLFEYGLVGLLPFAAFFLTCLFHRTPSPLLSTAVLVTYLFLGGYLVSAYMLFLYLALVIWHRPEDRGEPLPAARRRAPGARGTRRG